MRAGRTPALLLGVSLAALNFGGGAAWAANYCAPGACSGAATNQTAVGDGAGVAVTGDGNTGVGQEASVSVSGAANTGIGRFGSSTVTGHDNTGTGWQSS